MGQRTKIAVVSTPGLSNFVEPLADHLLANHYDLKAVYTGNHKEIADVCQWANIVLIDWANDLAQAMTTDLGLLAGKHVILWCHSYEIFREPVRHINWHRINDLVFVQPHIRDILFDRIPKIPKQVGNTHIIPNGVDIEKYRLVRHAPNKRMAYVGYINFKKGPMLLLHAFSELVWQDPEFTLHFAGMFQEPRYPLYFDHMIEELGLQDNVFYEGWQDDIDAWLEDKSYIVSSSVLESQGLGIMEAMAKGLKPLIHNFVGARNIYDPAHIWTSIPEFTEMAREPFHDSRACRNFIRMNYRRSKQVDAFREIVDAWKPKQVEAKRNGKPIKLSACLMVKNEEANLNRCLTSIEDIVDEIIVVDTGSTDRSIEICKAYGAKVYEHPWQDNFALHRNQSLEHATGDWLLQIDADEELTGNKKQFKKALSRVSFDYSGISIWLHDIMDEDVAVKFKPVRFFRRGTVYYEGIVHNEPKIDGACAFSPDVTLKHYGYYQITEEQKRAKSERTIALLHRRLEHDPYDWKAYFYLFQSYGWMGEDQKSLEAGETYLAHRDEISDFNDSIYFSVIDTYLKLGSIGRARYWLNEAIKVIPGDIDIAIAMLELGVHTNNGDTILQGAKQFENAYKFMAKNPTATDIRFTYGFRPESLVYCLHHASMAHLQGAAEKLGRLKESIGSIQSNNTQEQVYQEVANNLNVIGISKLMEDFQNVNERKC